MYQVLPLVCWIYSLQRIGALQPLVEQDESYGLPAERR
ncbi:hypothetical protein JOE32_004744 [Pseudomonas sp. PvP025]|jgi:hypothetical protein|nr:hypothetical protein [Pseudomonas sp. PvP025]MDQ0397214.1 hypothetical protein [Pseudomonas sp. PvP006]